MTPFKRDVLKSKEILTDWLTVCFRWTPRLPCPCPWPRQTSVRTKDTTLRIPFVPTSSSLALCWRWGLMTDTHTHTISLTHLHSVYLHESSLFCLPVCFWQINGTEATFAKKALFSRHPEMVDWPTDHNWFFAKMNITKVWVLDYFGGVKTVTPEDYFKATPYKRHHWVSSYWCFSLASEALSRNNP